MVNKKTTAKGTRKTANTLAMTKRTSPNTSTPRKDTHTGVDVGGGWTWLKPRTKTATTRMSKSSTPSITPSSNGGRPTGVNVAGSTPVYPRSTGMTGVSHQSKPRLSKTKKK